jgi:molecular chaperone DnaJ
MSNADWMNKDFYQVLGVSKEASADEIKKAYRKLARKNHPDAHPDDPTANDRFKEISEAYAVVGDPKRRKEYDEQRSLFGNGFRYPGRGDTTGGFDINDLFGQGTGGLGDLLGGIFTGGRNRSSGARPRRGADIETETRLGFESAIDGATVALRMTGEKPCPACRGTGARAGTVPRVCPTCEGAGMTMTSQGGFSIPEPCRDCRGRGLIVDDPCPVCHGSGRGTSSRTMQVRIPAGVRDGQRIRLRGKGAPGENGGPPGDLYVTVHADPHPTFGRSGDNLTITVPVRFDEAALGGEIAVPTLDGKTVKLKIPAGTPNGRTFRVRGRGVTRRDGTKGDLLVTVEVVVPTDLDDASREALQAYREATGAQDPRGSLFTRGG